MSEKRRQASISRKTNETNIEVFLDLDCAPGAGVTQTIEVSTGIGFLDHVSQPENPPPNVLDSRSLDVQCTRKTWRLVSETQM